MTIRKHYSLITALVITLAQPMATSAAEGVPSEKGAACTFVEGLRYSELVMNSRLNDFKANTTAAGFGKFDTTGRMTETPAGKKTTLDYVPGLVAKAVIEAVDYYKNNNICFEM